jgi:signal transduction histidine kinase
VRRAWPQLVAGTATLLVLLAQWGAAPPRTPSEWVGTAAIAAAAVSLAWCRRRPGAVAAVGPVLLAGLLVTGPEPSDAVLVLLGGFAALAGATFDGRAAWLAAGVAAGYLLMIYAASGDWRSPGLAVLTVPFYLAGTTLRLRRRTAEALAERVRELDQERELFTQVAVRNERARIASELHDIVGHALSVMVVQAAAGQRLAERDPDGARASLEAVAESARQGRADLQRLVDLLGGAQVGAPAGVAGSDLGLVDEVVTRAARSGLDVTCRFEGDRDGIEPGRAHLAFRVVQESLTNALRHAPGSVVRVLLRGEPGGRRLTVRVENDPAPTGPPTGLAGSGRGLQGLRERVLATGGSFVAGPSDDGGWRVEARL